KHRLQVERRVSQPDNGLAGHDAGMTQEAIVDDAFAEGALRMMQSHRQSGVVVRGGMQAVALPELPIKIGWLLAQAPLLPDIAEGTFRPGWRAHRRLATHGKRTALGRGFAWLLRDRHGH